MGSYSLFRHAALRADEYPQVAGAGLAGQRGLCVRQRHAQLAPVKFFGFAIGNRGFEREYHDNSDRAQVDQLEGARESRLHCEEFVLNLKRTNQRLGSRFACSRMILDVDAALCNGSAAGNRLRIVDLCTYPTWTPRFESNADILAGRHGCLALGLHPLRRFARCKPIPWPASSRRAFTIKPN